jgi:predicted kinase
MSEHFVVQMHGHPGSGKSLVARGLAGATGATILDRDVVKSTMLEYGHEDDDIAPVAYEVCLRLAGEIARQGHSVILDSTAYYPIIRNRGRQFAEEASAGYYIIDVVCSDEKELRRRLADRDNKPSQISAPEGDPYQQPGAAPVDEPHLQVDTCVHSIETCVRQAMDYIGR